MQRLLEAYVRFVKIALRHIPILVEEKRKESAIVAAGLFAVFFSIAVLSVFDQPSTASALSENSLYAIQGTEQDQHQKPVIRRHLSEIEQMALRVNPKGNSHLKPKCREKIIPVPKECRFLPVKKQQQPYRAVIVTDENTEHAKQLKELTIDPEEYSIKPEYQGGENLFPEYNIELEESAENVFLEIHNEDQ